MFLKVNSSYLEIRHNWFSSDSTLTSGSRHFTQPHPGTYFCWRVKQSEGTGRTRMTSCTFLEMKQQPTRAQ
ncbi:hypothetical protein DPMN_102058 [Dreissena polymorpha]|uniref:Uncharacterized protein n=1 Tax=Dreissena polymorpha TaxID=45954 RepID=A0A9D4LK57_DREPO|nr:hypothetical protein DPMN_102058 [Dreissena polymorpha]